MQGVTNAAPPSGGLRIVAQGTYTVTGPVNLTLSSPAVMAIVSSVAEEEVTEDLLVQQTAVLALEDAAYGVISQGNQSTKVALRKRSDGSCYIRVAYTYSGSMMIQYAAFA